MEAGTSLCGWSVCLVGSRWYWRWRYQERQGRETQDLWFVHLSPITKYRLKDFIISGTIFLMKKTLISNEPAFHSEDDFAPAIFLWLIIWKYPWFYSEQCKCHSCVSVYISSFMFTFCYSPCVLVARVGCLLVFVYPLEDNQRYRVNWRPCHTFSAWSWYYWFHPLRQFCDIK